MKVRFILMLVPLLASKFVFAQIYLVKDINLQGNANVGSFVVNNTGLYLVADDGVHGTELWKSDGTTANTSMVKDIHPAGSSLPVPLGTIGAMLLFTADDGVHGRELWVSDGTESGTMMVKEIVPGPSGAFATALGEIQGYFFFACQLGESIQLWKSDGTEAGTTLVKQFDGVIYFTFLYRDDDQIVFSMFDRIHIKSLFWSTSPQGTYPTSDTGVTRNNVSLYNILLYTTNVGLWRYDGISSKLIYSGFIDSFGPIILRDGYLYFASNGSILKTRGEEVMVAREFGSKYHIQDLISMDSVVYYTMMENDGNVRQLWMTAVTGETILVKTDFVISARLVKAGKRLYVIVPASDRTQVWEVNGPIICDKGSNTSLISINDYTPATSDYTVAVGKIFMHGTSSEYGNELFAFDVTSDPRCKNSQEITFAELPEGKRVHDESFTITAKATSRLPIIFTSSNTLVATIKDSTVTIAGPGQTEVTASQAGNQFWFEAAPVSHSLVVDVAVGLKQDQFHSIILYPNPFDRTLSIKLESPTAENTDIEVFSLLGQHIEQVQSLAPNIEHQIGLSWPVGIYILQIKMGERIFSYKVIKQ